MPNQNTLASAITTEACSLKPGAQSLAPKKVLIIAGEASGDLHAANLVKKIQQRDSSIQFFGMGSKYMQEAGVEIIEDCGKFSIVGFVEIFTRFHIVYSVFKKIQRILRNNQLDLVILVDCPGFNLRFAKIAKKAGIPVFYYISPQLWGWHQSRVKIIKKCVDMMAVIFPFEVQFYQKFGINAQFVGHPLINTVKPSLSIAEARSKFGLSSWVSSQSQHDAPLQDNTPAPSSLTSSHPYILTSFTIGLLPGSRKVEIKHLLPIMLKAATLLKKHFPNIEFILPLASTLTYEDLRPHLKNFLDLNIKIIASHTYDVINICDAVIIASGTATLETALLGVPMVVIYKLSPLTAFFGRLIMKVPYLCICNLIAGKQIVRELLQYDAKPEAICDEIIHILTDKNYQNIMRSELSRIKNSLKSDHAENAAELVLTLHEVGCAKSSRRTIFS